MNQSPSAYVFSDNSIHTRGFTWAMSIIPRSEMISKVCTRCRAVKRYPSGEFDVAVEGGSRYPDVLGCGAYPFLIVSERVIEAWQGAAIDCFHTFAVGLANVKSKRLAGAPAPHYYRVEIDGRCQIDVPRSGVEVVLLCPQCHHLVTRPAISPRFQMVPGSWDGTPLFRDALHYPRVSFCTQLIIDLATQHKLTNFRFEPMAGPFNPASRGIEYLPSPRKRR